MFTLHAAVPDLDVDFASFTAYEATKGVKKYFCTTCGAHMFDRGDEDDDDWYIAVALVDAEEGIWEWKGHYFVGSTGDGGVAVLMHEVEDSDGRGKRRLPLHDSWGTKDEKFRDGGDWVRPSARDEEKVGVYEHAKNEKDDRLLAQCHCGGVSFYIARPTGSESFKDVKDEGLIPKDKTKWFGSFDACDSCRLVSSTPLVSWIFPTPSAITLADGSPYPTDGSLGTAKKYSTSPGVNRTFCGTCGATVTYGCDDRKELVDVAAGLLRAPSGARAEDWIEWRTWRLSYEEDATFKGLVGSFRKALRESSGHESEKEKL